MLLQGLEVMLGVDRLSDRWVCLLTQMLLSLLARFSSCALFIRVQGAVRQLPPGFKLGFQRVGYGPSGSDQVLLSILIFDRASVIAP